MLRLNLKFSLLFFLLALAACQSNPASTGNSRVEEAQPKDSVVIGLSARPKTLDPRLSTDVASARVQQLVFNSLVKKNRNSELVPDLAEKWEMPDDTTYRFHLRKDVVFHNGKKLTAADVKATFDAVMNEKLGSLKRSAYDEIESITIEDDDTIVFKTKTPFAPFLINMVLGILPESEARKMRNDGAAQPVGTGPFRVSPESSGEKIVLTRFDKCFQGAPKLKKVVFRVIPDDTIRLMELEKGSIDFLQNNVPPDALKRIARNPKLKIMKAPGTSFYYIGINFRLDYPLRNRNVRQALAHAINRPQIIEHLLGGAATLATGVLPETHWMYNKDVPQVNYDPQLAGRLLDDAGYPLKDGVRFHLNFKCSQNKRSRRLAEALQSDWSRIGVALKIQSMEWGTFYDDIIKGNFETYILSWVGVTDPDIYYSLFYSGSVPPNGRNRGHYQSAEMDRLLEAGRVTLDPAKRAEIYRKVQALAARDLPYINLWHTQNIAVMKKNLQGFELYPAGDFDSFSRVYWASGE